jgi:hypothetical protein
MFHLVQNHHQVLQYKDILATIMCAKAIKYTYIIFEHTVRLGWTHPATLRKIQEDLHP